MVTNEAMIGFDPLYLLFIAPGMILAFIAQTMVSSRFARWSRVPTRRGMTGAEVASAILHVEGVSGVRIEPVDGMLSDHYDPTAKTLRLSPDVYAGRSVAAAGIAAHEVGHAIQHARAYPWLGMRSSLVPALGITSKLAMPTIIVGFLMMSVMHSQLGYAVLLLGIGLFSLMVLFQLITLPVEFDASRRALIAIERGQIVVGNELLGAKQVLSAAALTYVAAAVSSVMTLLYFLVRAGLLGGRRDD